MKDKLIILALLVAHVLTWGTLIAVTLRIIGR